MCAFLKTYFYASNVVEKVNQTEYLINILFGHMY